MKQIATSILLVLLGSFIYAVSVTTISIPNELGEGGVTGITLILYYVFNIAPSLSNLVINAFILLLGWRYLEPETLYYTILSVAAISFFLKFMPLPAFIPENTILAPIVAGVLIGLGIGLVVLGRGTTAGVDILAMMAQKFWGINLSTALMIIDTCIIIPLFWVIGIEKALMSLITVYMTTKVLSFMTQGFNPKQSLMIVSEHYEAIGDEIIKGLDRGITILEGQGYYSKEKKHVLYVVINRQESIKVQRLIHEIDPRAFVTITAASAVLGEGFTFYLDDETKQIKA